MNAIEPDLTAAIEAECTLLQFREDHEAKNERLDAMMLREKSEARKRIKRFEQARDEQLAAIAEERRALDERERTVVSGTKAKVAAERRRIAKVRAYLAAE